MSALNERELALVKAIDSRKDHDSDDVIVKRAEKFYDFLVNKPVA